MKGIIFNVIEEVVTDLFDHETWDELLRAADLEGAYTALGNYGDHEVEAIVAAGCSALGNSRDELLEVVGRKALPKLADRVPQSVTESPDAFSFIERVNMIIHPEVLKLYPGSVPPVFDCERDGDALLVTYRSTRDLGSLALGLLRAVGDRFDTELVIDTIGEDPPMFRVEAT